jgi:hypothetical protein
VDSIPVCQPRCKLTRALGQKKKKSFGNEDQYKADAGEAGHGPAGSGGGGW